MPLPPAELILWQQTVEITGDTGPVYEQLTHSPNLSPLLVERNHTLRVLTQRGEAVAWWGRFKPPPPVLDSYLLETPQISYERISDFEERTTWQYVIAVDDSEWPGDEQLQAFIDGAIEWPAPEDIHFLPRIGG